MNEVSVIMRVLSETLADYAARGLHLPPTYTAEVSRLLGSLAVLAGSGQKPGEAGNVVYVDFINHRTPPSGGDAA